MKNRCYFLICTFLLTQGLSSRCGAVDTCTTIVKAFNYPVTNALLTSNVALSPDGAYFAESESENTLRIINLANGDYSVFTGATEWFTAIAFSPDGKYLLTGSSSPGKSVRLWNVKTRAMEKRFVGNTKEIYSVAFSPDGKNVAAADLDSNIFIWNTETGELQKTIHAFTNSTQSITFSPDGRFLLASFGDFQYLAEHTARLWDISSGECVKTFSGHTGYVKSAVFSPDGKYIITTSYDKTARLWDATTGDSIRTFKGHNSLVYSARFSSDGHTLLTASDDATCRLWNIETGEQIRIFTIPGDKNCKIVSAEFLPDGNYIFSGSECRAALWETAGSTQVSSIHPAAARYPAVTLRVVNRNELHIATDGMLSAGLTLDLFRPDGRLLASTTLGSSEKKNTTIFLKYSPPSGVTYWRVTDLHTRAMIRSGSTVIQ